MARLLQHLFFILLVRPLVYLVLGLNVRHGERLPTTGPAVIVANHNSHLDTLVLMSLLPFRLLHRIRPAGAADYFMRNRVLAWFSTRIMGIVPVMRAKAGGNPLAGCFEALRAGNILILFPEGTRGEPERMEDTFKQGVRLIAQKFPDVPIYPVFLHGLGKALPKGEGLLVPMFCDIAVGKPMTFAAEHEVFLPRLREALGLLQAELGIREWT